MKREKGQKARVELNDRGFSLVELLISIAVLVIVMVPLMSNFFRSMQMNKRAEKLQLQSNLAASILEGLKANDMDTILKQFTGACEFDLISEEIAGGVKRLYDQGGNLTDTPPADEGTSYYFVIDRIKVGGSAYDALIRMDPVSYQDETAGIMNSYPMPEPINLDDKVNALLFSNGSEFGETTVYDEWALSSFVQWGRAYAQMKLEQSSEYLSYLAEYSRYLDIIEENALKTPRPADPPRPVEPTLESYAAQPGNQDYRYYFDPDYTIQIITKTMRVTVNQETVAYEIEYRCAWPKGSQAPQGIGEDNVQSLIVNHISGKTYANRIQNVYLFYTPSIFQELHQADTACLINTDATNPVNFYVAKQAPVTYPITIAREGGNVSAYTNIPMFTSYVDGMPEAGLGTVHQKVIRAEARDRIYEVKIEICKHVDSTDLSQRYLEVEYSLEGTKEE
jgi:prepilin-type N-terminal cleavage/methylation domain-containing protein